MSQQLETDGRRVSTLIELLVAPRILRRDPSNQKRFSGPQRRALRWPRGKVNSKPYLLLSGLSAECAVLCAPRAEENVATVHDRNGVEGGGGGVSDYLYHIGAHLFRRLVALAAVGGAGLEQDGVEFEQPGVVGARGDIGWP